MFKIAANCKAGGIVLILFWEVNKTMFLFYVFKMVRLDESLVLNKFTELRFFYL